MAHISSLHYGSNSATNQPRIRWTSPCLGPYDRPESRDLPCTFVWTDCHLYVIFGKVEVKICRINLSQIPKGVHTESPTIETISESIFFPASTNERGFVFLPRIVAGMEYVVFALGANADFPPTLIWGDINRDLGGWTEYNHQDGLKTLGCADATNLKGIYASSEMRFNVPIRSSLAWNQRTLVTCW
jgi:hypothetical protein